MSKCPRCEKETNITTMSWFNTDMICIECTDREKQHPDYEKAKQANYDAEKGGNMNFEGIGCPKTLYLF